jgi:hypothetical protein
LTAANLSRKVERGNGRSGTLKVRFVIVAAAFDGTQVPGLSITSIMLEERYGPRF